VCKLWVGFRVEFVASFAKQVPEFSVIQGLLIKNLSVFSQNSYNLSVIIDEDQQKLEKTRDVQPPMVFTCLLRFIRLYAWVSPDYTTPFDTSRLLYPLPHVELIPEFIALFEWMPQKLAPKSLATLLRMHDLESKAGGNVVRNLLRKMMRSSPVSAATRKEPELWLRDLPRCPDTIVAITNLFGETTSMMHFLADTVQACVESCTCRFSTCAELGLMAG
jgi:hypothetical protein